MRHSARTLRTGFKGVVVGGIVFAAIACASQAPPEPRLSLSYDGLTPIEGTLMTQVWVREGHSLARYRKVMLEGADIQYRPLEPGKLDEGFPITEEKKREFEQLITEEFDKALERLEMEEVATPGPDVLLVRGTMLDVVSKVPDSESRADGYRLDSVGQATFVVELIDSQSNSVLVRALDTRAAAIPGQTIADEEAGRAAIRQLISRWANMLVDALNDLTAIDELQGA